MFKDGDILWIKQGLFAISLAGWKVTWISRFLWIMWRRRQVIPSGICSECLRDVTGHAIGAYIRARRLSKSAVALRLTARPILDIALQYRFDSQQTFTRAFKKQFSLTPALYRRSPDWSSFGMRPPLRLGEFTLPKHEFITLPPTPAAWRDPELYL